MALYRETATGFVQEWASNPGAGYTAITAQPTDTLANRVTWWRNVDKGAQTSSWHPSEYRAPQDPAEAVLSMAFSKDAAFFSADGAGTVTDNYLGGSCTVSVYRGGSDVTDSEGWTLTKVDEGCTSTLTKAGGVWTLTITNVALLATKSGYVRVTATRTGSTTQVRDWNWMKVQNGASGLNGSRTAILEMYQWAVSAPSTFPSGSSTYTWATGQFTAPATLNGWSLTPPATVAGQTLWVCRTVYADSLTSATSSVTWNATAAYVAGGAGADGANGTRTAILELYRWSATTPTTFPSGSSTYTWATGAFTAPGTLNSWSLTPGAAVAGQTLYGCQVAYSDSLTTATSTVTWSTSTAYALGAAGTNGTDGTRGSRQILVTTADGVWADLTAWNGIVTQTGTNPVLSDLVTIAKTDGSVATSKFCTGNSASPGVWTTPNAYINGSLLVTGTVGANQIAAGSITTSKLAVGSGGNIVPNSGPVLGAETVDWKLGYYNTTTATGPTAGGAAERPAGGASIKVTATGAAVDKIFGLQSLDNFPVMPGVKYEFSAYLAGTNTKLLATKLIWCDANGNQLSVDGSGNPVYEQAGSGGNAAISTNIATWYRSTGITTPAPDNARQAFIIMRGTCASTSNPTMVASQIFVAQAGPNQTEVSPWSPSGVATLIDGSGIKTGSITADRLVAGTITADLINSGTIGASTIIMNGATSILKSSTYVAGSEGWQLKGNGSFEANSGTFKNVTVTGTLTATTTFSGTWTAANIPSLNASKITAGTIDASVIGVTNLNASNINTGTLNCASLTVTNLRANSITVGTLVTEQIGTNAVTAAGGVSGGGTTVASGSAYDFFTFSLSGVTYGRGNIAINWQILVSIDTATALQATVRIYRAVGGGGYVVSRTYEIGYNYTNIGYSGKHLFTGVYFDSTKNSSALDYKIEITNASATTINVIGRDAWYVEMKR